MCNIIFYIFRYLSWKILPMRESKSMSWDV